MADMAPAGALEAMEAVARISVEAPDEAELIGQALVAIADRLGWQVAINRLGPADASIRLHRLPSGGRSGDEVRCDSGPRAEALANGRACRVDDPRHAPGLDDLAAGVRTWLGAPLRAGGRSLGLLEATSERAAAFGEADERLLVALAMQLSAGLERLRHAAGAKRQAEEAETLRQACAAVTAGRSLDATIGLVLEQLERVVPYSSASVQLMRDGYLEIVGGAGWPEAEEVLGIRFPVPGDNPNSIVVETRRPHVLSDATARHLPFRAPPHGHIRSWLGVPMLHDQRVVGLLALDSVEAAHFGEHDAELALAFASQVAIAVETAHLLEAAEQRAEEAETLRQAGAAVAATLQPSEAIDRILEQLARVVPHSSASVQLLRDGELEIVGGRGWSDLSEVVGMRFPIPGDNPNSRVMESGEPVILADALAAYPAFGAAPHHHIVAWLGVPLVAQDRKIGMLVLDHPQRGYFTPGHARLVGAFADQVAIAIENARLFAEARELALTDPLTGLYNRRRFFELAAREVERASRYLRPLSAIMLDLDRFKSVNDTHGHSVGDEVLRRVAQHLRDHLRDADLACRYGGDELLALLVESALDAAQRVGERLRASIRELSFDTPSGPLTVTVSLGVSAIGEGCADLQALVDTADTALYAAKQAGRDRLVARTTR